METANLLKGKKLMVVVAHPDDELLGLGATMNRLIYDYKVTTHVVILGEGLTARADRRDTEKWKEELEIHRKNIHDAQQCIGFHSVSTYEFPDNRFDSVALLDIVKVVEKEKKRFQPELIFTHHGGDLNIDHQRTFESVMTACRPLSEEMVKTIITFETPSSTEWQSSVEPRSFTPNLFVKVSEKNLQAKIEGMEQYQFEKRQFPHPRSPEALRIRAQQHGSTVGCEYAEAFCLIRHVS